MMENENTLAPQTDGGIRSVDAGRGVEWLVGGFKLVFKTPGTWIVGGLIVMIAIVICNFIPLLGSILASMIYVVASGAAMRACAALEAGRDPVPDAKEAISNQSLLILGAIAGGLSLLITLFMGAMFITSGGAAMVSMSAGIGMGIMSGLITMVLFIVMFMALWLAPALVVFKNMDPINAMKLSLKATMKNLVPYIVLAILTAIASFFGAIPMGLGLLVVLPAAMCASYIAYRDMFA